MNDVLLLSDDNYLKRILLSELKPYHISLQVVDHITKGLESIQKHFFKSVVIQRTIISESCPKKVISQIKSIQPYIPIYFLMDQINHHEIISLVKHGAENIFMHPYNFTHLCQEIHETVKKISTLNEVPQWHPNKAGVKKATEIFHQDPVAPAADPEIVLVAHPVTPQVDPPTEVLQVCLSPKELE